MHEIFSINPIRELQTITMRNGFIYLVFGVPIPALCTLPLQRYNWAPLPHRTPWGFASRALHTDLSCDTVIAREKFSDKRVIIAYLKMRQLHYPAPCTPPSPSALSCLCTPATLPSLVHTATSAYLLPDRVHYADAICTAQVSCLASHHPEGLGHTLITQRVLNPTYSLNKRTGESTNERLPRKILQLFVPFFLYILKLQNDFPGYFHTGEL